MGAPLQSMTGYARAAGSVAGVAFTCEIKSVNGRGLDLRLRLPPGFDALDPELRRKIGKALSRGSITFSLGVESEGSGGDVVVNERALGTVLATLARLSNDIDADRPTLDGILAIKGVVEQRETHLGAADEERLHAAILAAADIALADLVIAREGEGKQVAMVLGERIEEIARLAAAAEAHPSRTREAVLARLREQVAMLQGSGLTEERLMQEAILLATKADIREELDRLGAHIKAAHALIAEGGPAGRKLDFLSQEFNREANTLCSKSNAVELTAIGLDLKAVIDQFREQVQNIE